MAEQSQRKEIFLETDAWLQLQENFSTSSLPTRVHAIRAAIAAFDKIIQTVPVKEIRSARQKQAIRRLETRIYELEAVIGEYKKNQTLAYKQIEQLIKEMETWKQNER